MRKINSLTKLLKRLVDLLEEEAGRNPDFAERLDELLSGLTKDSTKTAKSRATTPAELPDIHTEWRQRNETNFRLWLREQPIQVLRGLIRTHDFDPNRRSNKWMESEKLADFISDNLKNRLARGSSFLRQENTE